MYDPLNDKTIGFCPEYYDDMIAGYSKTAIMHPDFLFLGDSITEQGEWPKRLQNKKVINHGIKGDISMSVLRRLDETIRQKPKTVLLMIGVNDLAKGIPESEIVKNTLEIMSRLHHQIPRSTLILQSILPVNPGCFGFDTNFDNGEKIQKINTKLNRAGSDAPFRYLNLHGAFKDENNNLKTEFTTDGVHLNNAGYDHWLSILISEGILH